MVTKTKHTKCSVEGCTNPGIVVKGLVCFPKGFCNMHYLRFKKHGDVNYTPKHSTCCKVDGCKGAGKRRKGLMANGEPYGEVFPMGYCVMHAKRVRSHGDPMVTKVTPPGHDIRNNPLYTIWADIRTRCTNPNRSCYKNYGGRGIKMCLSWQGPGGFLKFVEDVGIRPSEDYSIDRIDNNGHYEPGNVKWSTRHEQAANQRTNNKTVGVCWYKAYNKWSAYIKVKGVSYHLGYHEFYEDAVKARKDAEKRFGIVYSRPTKEPQP